MLHENSFLSHGVTINFPPSHDCWRFPGHKWWGSMMSNGNTWKSPVLFGWDGNRIWSCWFWSCSSMQVSGRESVPFRAMFPHQSVNTSLLFQSGIDHNMLRTWLGSFLADRDVLLPLVVQQGSSLGIFGGSTIHPEGWNSKKKRSIWLIIQVDALIVGLGQSLGGQQGQHTAMIEDTRYRGGEFWWQVQAQFIAASWWLSRGTVKRPQNQLQISSGT